MRAHLWVTATIILLASSAGAESRLRFDILPGAGYAFGTTRYRMEQTTVISQLDFPLDQVVGGGRVQLTMLRDERPDWSVSAEIATALGDPHGTFDDRDWFVLGDGSEFLFSTTKSHVEGSMIRLRGDVTKTALRENSWDIAVFAGFVYQSISQTAVDVAGSQLIPDSLGGGWVYFDYEARALAYDIDFYQSLVGIVPRLYPSPLLTVEARLAISPILYAKDVDDHLLRGFTSTSAGYGFGWSARLAFRFEPDVRREGGRLFGQLVGDYYHTRTNRPTVVEYYSNVAGEPYAKGDILYGIPHEIVGNQFGVNLQIGFTF